MDNDAFVGRVNGHTALRHANHKLIESLAQLAEHHQIAGHSANDMSGYACILNATGEPEDTDTISTFNTIDELKRFVDAHPNTKPEDYDQELFDAVSTYIDTVINYIGK